MNNKLLGLFEGPFMIFFLSFIVISIYAQGPDTFTEIDVLHYSGQVEPDITNKSIQGKVIIQFLIKGKDQGKIKLDCGELIIESVHIGKLAVPFDHRNNLLLLPYTFKKDKRVQEVEILYHGKPRWGINFFPVLEEVYTVFSTAQWLVCKDSPDDKATLELSLIMPSGLQVISNGDLAQETPLGNQKIMYVWSQKIPAPTYTFGFVAGHFTQLTEQRGKIRFQYFAKDHSEAELKQIFAETGAMLNFFEDHSGVPYPGNVYSQVLTEGNVFQEMSGFAVLRSSYGKQVLANALEINLLAHELAHQWWGNQVTCLDWNHFWLNEGLAVFMSSAYKERRFGRDEYLKDIDVYLKAYQKVVDQEMDKPLIFSDWSHPTSDDRTLVYFKGAYVLHLLREEMGEKEFWNGIKLYTTSFFGKSVITQNLQEAMEQAAGQDLNAFFSTWIK